MVFNFGWAPQLFGASRSGGRRRHAGIDLGTGGRKNVPVGCPISGFKVHAVSYRRGYGNTVDLISEDGTKMMRFAHLAQLPKHLTVGESVHKGDWLGNVGNSGGNYAIHLHFEYRNLENGSFVPVNPFNNQFHSFSKEDFEQSTNMAQKSRDLIQNGMTLAQSQASLWGTSDNSSDIPLFNQGRLAIDMPTNGSFLSLGASQYLTNQNNVTQAQLRNVWSLNKTFDAPDFWERYMPEMFGGWSSERIEEADRQRQLDEEVFKGIRRAEMLQAGLSNQEIDLVRQYVDDQIKEQGAAYHLGQSSIPIDFDAVFEDPERAAVARNYFDNRAKQQNQLGIPLDDLTQQIDLANNKRNGSNSMG